MDNVLVANEAWQLSLPKPEPSLGIAAYRRERRAALLRSPRKLWNYRCYLRAQRTEHLDYLPIKIDIENVSRCNFRCVMCQVSDWPKLKRAEDMSFDDFKTLIDSQHGLVEIKIQGMGEPTLARDTLFRMIRYARSKRIWVRTITNASLLHLNDNYSKMIDSGANEVQISIDGASKDTFEGIRRGSKFEQVIENCKLINSYAANKRRYSTKMWVVVQQANYQELNELVHLASEIGFRNVVFSLELLGWGQDSWNEINSGLSAQDQVTPELAQELLDQGLQYGIKVGFWTAVAKYSASRPESMCPWPFERAYISSDMRIVPCCMLANPEVSDLGEAKQFSEHWNGRLYREFRQDHLEGNIPSVCRECYSDSGASSQVLVL